MQEQETGFDWFCICGKVKELVPKGLRELKGKSVSSAFFVGANLGHDKVTGRSCSQFLAMLNLTPIDWFSELQNTVETATHGSDFCVARQAIDKISADRHKLRALSAPLDGPACMFGDNKPVVLSSTIPTHGLNKWHNFLACH